MTQTRPAMRFRSVLLRLFCLACCASAARAQTAARPAMLATTSFTLEPGDVLRVAVWQERELSCDCQVDEVGRLTLPMLGVVRVDGRAWDGLRDSLLAAYGRELRNPSVTLTPLRRVWVLGEVLRPGPILADPTMSLAGLVALAGGATPNGDLHKVRVVRDGKAIIEGASVESLLLQAGMHSNDQIFIDRRGWVERNGAVVASTLIATASILVTILRR